MADAAEEGKVGKRADADGNEGGAAGVTVLPAGNGGLGIVGCAAVGEQIDEGFVVAFTVWGVGDDAAVYFVHDVLQGCAERSAGTDRQTGRIKGGQLHQRGEGFRHAGKGDDGEVDGFQRVRVLAQGGNQAGDAVLHLAQGRTNHAFGYVYHKKHGETAHGCVLSGGGGDVWQAA